MGAFKTFKMVRKKLYMNNMLKVKTFIQACDMCQRSKGHTTVVRPYHAQIPVDYKPLEHLSCDIKYMPKTVFDMFKFILVATCEYTNIVFAKPLKEITSIAISNALLHRIICIFGPPKLFDSGQRFRIDQYSHKIYFGSHRLSIMGDQSI